MKIKKMIELLRKCDPDAVVKMHHREGESLKMINTFLGCIALQTGDEKYANPARADYMEEKFTVYNLLEALSSYRDRHDVIMHSLRDGKPVLFVVSYENIPGVVVLEDADDNDLSSELEARFENAAEQQMDELDFFMDLIDTGFTLDDIKEHLPEQYEYSRMFMTLHGLA